MLKWNLPGILCLSIPGFLHAWLAQLRSCSLFRKKDWITALPETQLRETVKLYPLKFAYYGPHHIPDKCTFLLGYWMYATVVYAWVRQRSDLPAPWALCSLRLGSCSDSSTIQPAEYRLKISTYILFFSHYFQIFPLNRLNRYHFYKSKKKKRFKRISICYFNLYLDIWVFTKLFSFRRKE